MNTENKKDHDLFEKANQAWEDGDLKNAFELFMHSVKKGDTYSFNSVGYFYDNGIYVNQDEDIALRWYLKAARFGDICAYSNIGLLYKKRGNFKRAKFWFLKSAEKGDGDAILEIAKLYLSKTTMISSKKAMNYLQLAIESTDITPSSKQEAKRLLQREKI